MEERNHMNTQEALEALRHLDLELYIVEGIPDRECGVRAILGSAGDLVEIVVRAPTEKKARFVALAIEIISHSNPENPGAEITTNTNENHLQSPITET